EALQSVAQTVADAFQYPEIACARLIVEGREYKTANFEETIWNLDKDIWCEGEKIGVLEVCYLKMLQEADIGPFLREELNLLSSVAVQVGEYIELRRIQQRRIEQHQELELYASLLRHDLKNDLSAILGNIDILKMLLNNADEETNKTISSVEAVCERMNSLLTALSRPAESIETNLYALIARIANQTTEEEPQLTIDITADPDVKDARIPASRFLPTVFENLFRNSLDFVEQNPVIAVNLRKTNETVVAVISDNGPGVNEELKDTLFERGSSTRGGGMGLYLSKQIIEGLDGSIELVDTPAGEGATFRIVLPVS
ncbi:MAG: HAMP domain-containing histidine kinase, partial [Candidatus Thorarchaeota archaeon]|nr:HAMP domain-containing histidine kinase [Candidatus Thorarchaeota archaeon]